MLDKLYFDNLFIGEIEFKDGDFPWLSGSFKLTLGPNDNLSEHILNYIVFSKLNSKKFDLDPINYPYEDESINEEMKYIDLIETDNCKIVSENGSIENILIPVFGNDNTMNWRLNFST